VNHRQTIRSVLASFRYAVAGAWGCFDEFNRISVEVLSVRSWQAATICHDSLHPQVVAVQVKTIQDAIRDRKQRFNFMGTDISLNPNVGLFITMVKRRPPLFHPIDVYMSPMVESGLRRSNRITRELEGSLSSMCHGGA
jgi:hypothetical protein